MFSLSIYCIRRSYYLEHYTNIVFTSSKSRPSTRSSQDATDSSPS
jgi:hypothetical protein